MLYGFSRWSLDYFFRCWGFAVAAITPGPNNMLLTSSGANFGFMRSIPLMLGIMLGMQSLLLLVAFGVEPAAGLSRAAYHAKNTG